MRRQVGKRQRQQGSPRHVYLQTSRPLIVDDWKWPFDVNSGADSSDDVHSTHVGVWEASWWRIQKVVGLLRQLAHVCYCDANFCSRWSLSSRARSAWRMMTHGKSLILPSIASQGCIKLKLTAVMSIEIAGKESDVECADCREFSAFKIGSFKSNFHSALKRNFHIEIPASFTDFPICLSRKQSRESFASNLVASAVVESEIFVSPFRLFLGVYFYLSKTFHEKLPRQAKQSGEVCRKRSRGIEDRSVKYHPRILSDHVMFDVRWWN